MAKRVTLTNQGLSLLASSSEATGQYYWLGYYALAYVPNLWKNDTVDLPVDECGKVNEGSIGSTPIGETDTDKVIPAMTRLTKYGDMIYNVWQGDLNGTGYLHCASDGSPGGDLFSLSMYNTNIKKHYRYVLDENGNNTLVGWIEDPAASDGRMLGKHVFKGTDGYVSSTMPIPAPLYYVGDVTGKTSVDSFFNDLPTFEETAGPSGNGADIYPYITVTLKATGNPTLDIPRVSADYRGYTDSQGNPGSWNYGSTPTTPYTSPGTYFDTLEIPYPINSGFDETSWFAADQTFNVSGSSATDEIYGEEFWKLLTISNYNRFHAPVDNVGHVLSSDLSNRNMAKTTKFFPISNYKVINSESSFRYNGEVVEVATAIKLSIDVDITPRTIDQGFNENCDFDEDNNIEFFEKYNNPLNPTGTTDEYGKNIYDSTHTSFKFNRIGIYAVPLRKAPYVQDQGFGTDPSGNNVKLEFQINPDEEPVLFAVLDWDNVISMSDTGDGINQFRAEIDVNLQTPDNSDESALIRDTTIFYNLYEDDALHWYQNQLIANASTQNAITEIGLEVAHIKNNKGDGKCCPPPDLSGKYAPLNHTHDFLRNLKDANNKLEDGLKGIATVTEGSTVDGDVYKVGLASMVLGKDNAVSGDYSIIGNGQNNIINKGATDSGILAGNQNQITTDSIQAIILGGLSNTIENESLRSMIGTGNANNLQYVNDSVIVSGDGNSIIGTDSTHVIRGFIGSGFSNYINGTTSSNDSSAIVAGLNGQIDSSIGSVIGGGDGNYIYNSSDVSMIGAGFNNSIFADASYSFIGAGQGNDINGSSSGFIGAGTGNEIISGAYEFIGAGSSNLINNAAYTGIVSGYNNYIGINSTYSFIGAGLGNSIFANSDLYVPEPVSFAAIVAGSNNRIENSCTYGFIGAGNSNRLHKSTFAGIVAGQSNYIGINGTFSFIGAGSTNYVMTQFAGIGSGQYNYIAGSSTFSFIGGGYRNQIGYDGTIDPSGSALAASILGGMSNYIEDDADYASIIGGKDTLVRVLGEVAHSSGAIRDPDNPDTATNIEAYNKHSVIMLRGRTTNSQQTITMSLTDSAGENIEMRRGDGFGGTLNIVGYLPEVYTPDFCALNGSRSMDIVYHEMHSVSGVYTKEVISGASVSADATSLTYNEYDRSNNAAIGEDSYNADALTLTSLTGVAGGTLATVVTTAAHGLVSGQTIAVYNSTDTAYNTFTPVPITVLTTTSFTYTTSSIITDPTPSGFGGIGLPSVNHVYYGPRNIDHAPSIVDTVIDYRYTRTPGYDCTFGSSNGTDIQDGFPVITFGVNASTGVLSLSVDASELYALQDTNQIVEGPIYWVATFDLTWIQVQ